MDTLNGMRLFVRVADAKSFTKAAALASVTNAQLTRAIAELESRLRTRLLNRTTRRMSLTEAGERYLRRCEEILECVDLAESEARGASLWPSGRLRVHCSTGFGQHYLAPAIARYNREYPDVEIELVLAQRAPDMIEEGFDVSVVVSPELPPSSFVAQRIGSASIVLCASPTYLSARGHPGRLSDLNHHTCLQLAMPGSSAGQWVFDGPDAHVFQLPHRAAFTVNVAEAFVGTLQQACAVVDGAGKANGAVLVDALHLSRSGGTPDEMKRLHSDIVRAVQLCDASAQAPGPIIDAAAPMSAGAEFRLRSKRRRSNRGVVFHRGYVAVWARRHAGSPHS